MSEPQNPLRTRKPADKKRPARPVADASVEGKTSASPVGDTTMPPVDESGRLPLGAISAMSEADRQKVKAESGRSTGTNRAQIDTLTMPATGPDQAEQALTDGLGAKGDADRVYAGDGAFSDGKPDAGGESAVPHDWKMSQPTAAPALSSETPYAHHASTPTWPSSSHVSPEVLSTMIAEAAYYRAERRGFYSGYDIEDWLGAEGEIVARLHELERAARSGLSGG